MFHRGRGAPEQRPIRGTWNRYARQRASSALNPTADGVECRFQASGDQPFPSGMDAATTAPTCSGRFPSFLLTDARRPQSRNWTIVPVQREPRLMLVLDADFDARCAGDHFTWEVRFVKVKAALGPLKAEVAWARERERETELFAPTCLRVKVRVGRCSPTVITRVVFGAFRARYVFGDLTRPSLIQDHN